MTRVTIADADPASRAVLADALGVESYEVTLAPDGQDLLRSVAVKSPDVLLVDAATLLSARAEGFAVAGEGGPTVIAIADPGAAEDLSAAGATDGILRPLDPVIVRARVRAALAAAEARGQAQAAGRLMDRLCHEFRTPLAVIREYASILEEGAVDPVTGRQREFLRVISDAAADMARLAADAQDGVRLRSGELRLDLRACKVSDILDPVAPIVETRAASRGVRFCPRIECPSREVFADEQTMRRVVANLAIAAVKLSPPGGRVELWARPDGSNGVEISVTSSGVTAGAGQEIARRIGRVLEANPGGDGMDLGLGIASALVRLNLGVVRVGPDRGGGCTVSFALPGCDPAAILQRYFERLCGGRAVPGRVYAFRVGWSGPLRRHDVWAFLASTCDPGDLVLPVAGERGLLVIGPSGSVGGWIDRLRGCWGRALTAAGRAGDIEVDPVGSWSLPRRRGEAQALLAELLGSKGPGRRGVLRSRRPVPSRAARGVG